jgi:ankyrin repeat protein
LRIALFGTAEELRALLDAGLDSNSKTANGVTVLMAAASDAGKVKLLLSRGADSKARASSDRTHSQLRQRIVVQRVR